MIASYTALLQLNVTGVWGVKVLTSASSLTTWVFINGQQVPLNSTTQIGIFTAKAIGEKGARGVCERSLCWVGDAARKKGCMPRVGEGETALGEISLERVSPWDNDRAGSIPSQVPPRPAFCATLQGGSALSCASRSRKLA